MTAFLQFSFRKKPAISGMLTMKKSLLQKLLSRKWTSGGSATNSAKILISLQIKVEGYKTVQTQASHG